MANKKTAYHSELVKRSPIEITVKTDVMKSQFEGKSKYVVLIIDGEDRNYNCESDQIEQFFHGKKGQTLSIAAEGDGRDGTAKIIGVGQRGFSGTAQKTNQQPENQNRQAGGDHQEPVQRQQSSAQVSDSQMTEAVALKEARVFVARRLSLLKICTVATLKFAEEFNKSPEAERIGMQMTSEHFWNRVTSLYISAEQQGLAMRSGFADAAPVNVTFPKLEIVPSNKKPAAAAPPERTDPKCVQCGAKGVELVVGKCLPCGTPPPMDTDDVPF